MLTERDIYLFKEGTHGRLYEKLGCQLVSESGTDGARFTVWAPNARRVLVFGDFNEWNAATHSLTSRNDDSGLWEGFVPDVKAGARYKYRIESRYADFRVDKSDPFAFYSETPPLTGSRAWRLDYEWRDEDGCVSAASVMRSPPRTPFTKCIWGPGDVAKAIGCSAIARSRRCSRAMQWRRGSRMWS